MLKLFILLGLFAICYAGYEPSIVGGLQIPIQSVPFAVSVIGPGTKGRTHFSTGTILNKRWILTTASGLKNFTDPHAFTIGTEAMNNVDIYNVEDKVEHPAYNFESKDYNMVLLKVDRDMIFKKTIASIKLFSADSVDSNLSGNLIGWGFNAANVLELLSVEFKTVGTVDGFKLNVVPISDVVCVSDVGGPFVVDSKLYGISTLERLGCGLTDQYVTRIDTTTLEWIQTVIVVD